MIRALVVDDEDLPRLQLKNMLLTFDDVEVLEACDGVEALESIQEKQPNVVFLDIEMPGLDGFEVLRHLRSPPPIVFATAYDEYAVRAFEANALDYLLKPIQADRLRRTLDRVRLLLKEPATHYEAALRNILRELHHAPPTRLAVRANKRIALLPLRAVQWAGVEDRLVFLHTGSEKFVSDRTIGELEEMLKDTGFFRINRSDLVNIEHVRELAPWSSGTYRLKLAGGTELNVSRDRVRKLKSIVGL